MRIILATGIYPPDIGGPATALFLVAQELRAAKHTVTILTYGEARDESHVIAISRKGSILSRYIRYARAARELLAHADVVVATDVFSVGIPIRLALIGKKTRFILRLGGEWAWEDAVEKQRVFTTLRFFWEKYSSTWFVYLQKMHYQWLMRRADLVVTTSELLTKLFHAQFPVVADKCVTVWNASVAPQSKQSEDLKPHASLRFVYIGRFARVKNVPFIARIFKQLYEQGVHIECTFVGDGETLDECKTILQDVPGMVFVGSASRTVVQNALQTHDALVLPSLSDICPNSVIEALAYWVPCLITAEHGLPRPLAGVIELDPLDERVWVQAIMRLATSPEHYNALRQMVAPVTFPQVKTLAECIVS